MRAITGALFTNNFSIKVGKNILLNRLTNLNNTIGFEWLNQSYVSYKSDLNKDLAMVYTNENWFVILLSRVYFGDLVTERYYFSPLNSKYSAQLRTPIKNSPVDMVG